MTTGQPVYATIHHWLIKTSVLIHLKRCLRPASMIKLWETFEHVPWKSNTVGLFDTNKQKARVTACMTRLYEHFMFLMFSLIWQWHSEYCDVIKRRSHVLMSYKTVYWYESFIVNYTTKPKQKCSSKPAVARYMYLRINNAIKDSRLHPARIFSNNNNNSIRIFIAP